MDTYIIECDYCDAESHIVSKRRTRILSNMWHSEARPVLLDKEEDDV